jgi:ankyrin repeat protein
MPSEDFTVAALLVQQRARALEVAVSTPAPDSSELPEDIDSEAILARISRALSSAAQLLIGRVIDRRAMTDLRYQAQLAVKRRQPAEVPHVVGENVAPSDDGARDTGLPEQEEVPLEDGPDTIVELTLNLTGRRHLPPHCETDTPIFRAICQDRTEEVPLNAALLTSVRDALGQTPLHLAASIGRSRLVKRLLAAAQDSPSVSLNMLLGQKNNASLTPLDSALVHGYDRTAAVLLAAGAALLLPVDSLLLSLIQRGRYRTAELILKAELVRVNHEIVRRSGSRQAAAWAMEHLDLRPEDEIRLAIRLGLPRRLKKHDPAHVSPVKFSQCSHLWGPDCHAGHVRVIKWLLEHGRIDPLELWTAPVDLVPPAKRGDKETSEPEDGWPLLLAAASGNVQLTQVLLSYAEDSVNRQTRSGRTALSLACYKSHVSVVHALLEAGADPNLCELAGNPPLVPVCWQGNAQIAKLLLQHGADPRLHDPERDSLLLVCARTGHTDILTAVLKVFSREELPAQLEWRAAIDGFDALEAAVEQDRAACLPILVAAGANVTRRTAIDNTLLPGATAVHLAAHFGSVACLRMLHTLGADLSARTNEPELRTPLHLAVMRGHVETTAFLLSLEEGRAQLSCTDGLGKLPRYYAAMQGNERVYDLFFHNALCTPLLKCILAGSSTIVRVLAKYAEAPPLLTLAKHVQTLDLGCSGLSPMSLDTLLHGRDGHVARTLVEHGGCAWSTPDASGLSPAFYGQLLWRRGDGEGVREAGAYRGFEDEGDLETASALARLEIFEQRDTQARLLLDLSKLRSTSQTDGAGELRRNAGRSQFFPLDPARAAIATDMGVVMNEGFGCRADEDAAEEFTEAMADGDAFLLGLVERLLRQLLPERHDEVLCAAKLSVIRAVGLGLVPAGARAAELLAMHLATADVRILQRLNQCLLTASMQDDGWMAAAVSLAKGMTKLPPYVGECYRRVNASFTRWSIGTVLSWDAFTVCSADWATVTDDRVPGLVFIIKSNGGGRLLGPLAAVPQNAPVVFPPHARFSVVAFYRYSPTALGQANIRETSFGAKAAHFAKAEEGRASIIVEVEEVRGLAEDTM